MKATLCKFCKSIFPFVSSTHKYIFLLSDNHFENFPLLPPKQPCECQQISNDLEYVKGNSTFLSLFRYLNDR